MSTYLLAWNPNLWQWKDLEEKSARVKNGEEVIEDWSMANRNARIGDRIFILRVGVEPRGIFASGTIIKNPYERLHWDPNKAKLGVKQFAVDGKFDILLVPGVDEIFTRDRLNAPPLASMHWDTQLSGVLIPDPIAIALEDAWKLFISSGELPSQLVLEREKIYRRTDLHQYFKGQQQGGISTPRDSKYILLFTGETGDQYGYKDDWSDDGIFNYTGEGQVGDMGFVRGNLAILHHQEDGKELLLFKYISPGLVRFIDYMTLIGHHNKVGKDIRGNDRNVIVFELIPSSHLSNLAPAEVPQPELENLSLEELREKALKDAGSGRTPIERKNLYYQRSNAIKVYIQKRANGICEGCGSPAPFVKTDGKPFLENHHIRKISDGGPDHPEWVVAVCPNCHKRAHYSVDASEFNKELREYALHKEQIM
jgi:5-methylcytosine-specific restriction protein A